MNAPSFPAQRSASSSGGPPLGDEGERATRQRFTVDGDDRLEEHLEQACRRIGAGLRGLLPPAKLQAILLGGGYGRGEGGVLRTESGDQPYNDLEFYVCLQGRRHVNQVIHGRAVHVLGEILTPQAGVEVEFHLTSIDELAASAVSMYSYDLVCGHRWLLGDDTLLQGCDHHRNAEAIPAGEGIRLLMNRCTGLLLAQERLGRKTLTPGDADFVARNIAKAQLGAGDAILAVCGEYHWSVRERQRRMERLARSEQVPWFADLCRHYRAGVEFKLHPQRSTAPRGTLLLQHADVTQLCREAWLWVESKRLGKPFPTIIDYVEDRAPKWPTQARNVLVNAKVLGPAALFSLRAPLHPRERLLRTLPLLLWQPDALTSPSHRARLQRELRTTATDYPRLFAAYRSIWSQVN